MPRRSTHAQILDALAQVILDLGLTGLGMPGTLPPEQVYVRKVPTDRYTTLPLVQVSLIPDEPDAVKTATTRQDDWTYPALVTILAAANQELPLDDQADDFLYWREQIATALHNQVPAAVKAGVTKSLRWTYTEPGPVLVGNTFIEGNLWLSVLRVFTIVGNTR
jgi:hypothetical protein